MMLTDGEMGALCSMAGGDAGWLRPLLEAELGPGSPLASMPDRCVMPDGPWECYNCNMCSEWMPGVLELACRLYLGGLGYDVVVRHADGDWEEAGF